MTNIEATGTDNTLGGLGGVYETDEDGMEWYVVYYKPDFTDENSPEYEIGRLAKKVADLEGQEQAFQHAMIAALQALVESYGMESEPVIVPPTHFATEGNGTPIENTLCPVCGSQDLSPGVRYSRGEEEDRFYCRACKSDIPAKARREPPTH